MKHQAVVLLSSRCRMRKEQKEGRLHPKREAPKVVKKSVDNDEETQATLKRITVVQASAHFA